MKYIILLTLLAFSSCNSKKEEPKAEHHGHSHAQNAIEETYTYDPFFLDVMSMHFEQEMRLATLGMQKTKNVTILNFSQKVMAIEAQDLEKIKAWREELYKKVPKVEKDKFDLSELENAKEKDFDKKFIERFKQLTSKGMEISKMGAEQNFEPAIKTYADEVQGRLAERLINLEKVK